MWQSIRNDLYSLIFLVNKQPPPASRWELLKLAMRMDAFHVLLLHRLRVWARQNTIPGLNHLFRRMQMIFYGIEIGNDVTLGTGVWFIHTSGVVIGGNSRIGSGVRFFGSNTVGTAKDNGYPIIEDQCSIGAGARILGPIRIGAHCTIGANAVALTDLPAHSVAVGAPAVVKRYNS